MAGMRWTIRGVGFFSLMLLARLLSPTEFGLVAPANSLAALPAVITELGLELAIIRERSASPDIYNAAWAIRLLQMSFAGLCIVVASPWLASLCGNARLAQMLLTFALILILQGLENTWVISFRRLNFRFELAHSANIRAATAFVI
jgi:O-antigen/teichoic acid export membrane protein